MLERIGDNPQVLIVDFGSVSLCDGSAAHAFAAMAKRLLKSGTTIYLSALRPDVARMLAQVGLAEPEIHLVGDIKEALNQATSHLKD